MQNDVSELCSQMHRLVDEELDQDQYPFTLEALDRANKLLGSWLENKNAKPPTFPIPSTFEPLRAHKAIFTQEFLSFLHKTGGMLPRIDYIETAHHMNSKGWRTLQLRMYGLDTLLLQKFPQTTSIILHHFPDVLTIMFSVLEPHTVIHTHVGYYCGLVRYHLPLVVPEESYLVVNGEKHLSQNELFFDDTFPHSAHNPSSEFRIVLILDFARQFEDEELKRVNALVLRATTTLPILKEDVRKINAIAVSV
jgi:hypothetical protein